VKKKGHFHGGLTKSHVLSQARAKKNGAAETGALRTEYLYSNLLYYSSKALWNFKMFLPSWDRKFQNSIQNCSNCHADDLDLSEYSIARILFGG